MKNQNSNDSISAEKLIDVAVNASTSEFNMYIKDNYYLLENILKEEPNEFYELASEVVMNDKIEIVNQLLFIKKICKLDIRDNCKEHFALNLSDKPIENDKLANDYLEQAEQVFQNKFKFSYVLMSNIYENISREHLKKDCTVNTKIMQIMVENKDDVIKGIDLKNKDNYIKFFEIYGDKECDNFKLLSLGVGNKIRSLSMQESNSSQKEENKLVRQLEEFRYNRKLKEANNEAVKNSFFALGGYAPE